MQNQRASGGWCDGVRYHIRHNQQNDAGPDGYGTFTMGASHYEDAPGGCYDIRHRVLSFNLARDEINDKFRAYHSQDWVYWGNTNFWNQCDFSVQGDGWMSRLVIP